MANQNNSNARNVPSSVMQGAFGSYAGAIQSALEIGDVVANIEDEAVGTAAYIDRKLKEATDNDTEAYALETLGISALVGAKMSSGLTIKNLLTNPKSISPTGALKGGIAVPAALATAYGVGVPMTELGLAITDKRGITSDKSIGFESTFDPIINTPFGKMKAEDAYKDYLAPALIPLFNYYKSGKDYQKYLKSIKPSEIPKPRSPVIIVQTPSTKTPLGLLPTRESTELEDLLNKLKEPTTPETKTLTRTEYLEKIGEDIEKTKIKDLERIKGIFPKIPTVFLKEPTAPKPSTVVVPERFKGKVPTWEETLKNNKEFAKKIKDNAKKQIEQKISETAAATSRASKVFNTLSKGLNTLTSVINITEAATYALEGDYTDAKLKLAEIAILELGARVPGPLLAKIAGLAAGIGTSIYLDTLIAQNRKKFLKQKEEKGLGIKGITIDENGKPLVSSDAKSLSEEEAMKYLTKGRQIEQVDNKWYLVDVDKEKAVQKPVDVVFKISLEAELPKLNTIEEQKIISLPAVIRPPEAPLPQGVKTYPITTVEGATPPVSVPLPTPIKETIQQQTASTTNMTQELSDIKENLNTLTRTLGANAGNVNVGGTTNNTIINNITTPLDVHTERRQYNDITGRHRTYVPKF